MRIESDKGTRAEARVWIVDVYGYGPSDYAAKSKGAALYKAYLAFGDAFGRQSFRDFLARGVKVKRARGLV